MFLLFAISAHFDFVLIGFLKKSSHEMVGGSEYYGDTYRIYIIVLYCSILVSSMCFATSFAVSYIIDSQKTYYIFLTSMIIYIIIFGGTFNLYFGKMPGTYSVGRLSSNQVLFPWSLYWLGLINPVFAPSQLISRAYDFTVFRYSGDPGVGSFSPVINESTSIVARLMFNSENDWLWTFQNVFVYIEMFILLGIGFTLSKLTRG